MILLRWFILIAVLFSWPALVLAEASPVLHHDMDVRLDPKARGISVSDRMRIHGHGRVVFQLSPSLVITSFSVDGRRLSSSRMGSDLNVDLGASGEHRVTIEYRGTLARLPESFSGYAPTVPIASAEGSYLPDSAGWYPSLGGGGEFTYRIAVQVPEPQKAVMPGRLVEETSVKGDYRAVFASDNPTNQLELFAGPYVIEERFSGKIRLRTYFHPKIAPMAPDYLESTAGYIDRYRERIGEYPFSAFHVVSGPLPVGLGYAGLTYMGVNVLRLPFIRHTSLGHEVAHNWWGNGVYIDYESGNWGEGLTTFMADYAYAEDKGAEKGREMRLGWLRDYAALPRGRDHPAVAFRSKTHEASQVVGYNKVAFVFHMLRRELGEKVFAASLRRFWQTMKFRIASWDDLRRAFEEESGRPLKGFFDQWLRRAGAPKLNLGPVRTEAVGDLFRVSFTLAQEDIVYALTAPVRVTTENGVKDFDVTLKSRETHQEIYTESRPLALAVDPDFDIFRRLDAAETPPILKDVTLKPDAVAIILAADSKASEAARRLAGRMMDMPPRFEEADANLPEAPLLVIGLTPQIKAFLGAARLGGMPSNLAGRGTARVWAARHGAWPLVVVAADDAQALEALLRPLPHYGRKGYLVFEGRRAAEYGTWPSTGGPLTKRFD